LKAVRTFKFASRSICYSEKQDPSFGAFPANNTLHETAYMISSGQVRFTQC